MNADLNAVLKSMFKLLVQACWWVLEMNRRVKALFN